MNQRYECLWKEYDTTYYSGTPHPGVPRHNDSHCPSANRLVIEENVSERIVKKFEVNYQKVRGKLGKLSWSHRLHDYTTLITKILKRNRLAKFLSTVETNSANFDAGHVKELQNHVFWS